MDMCMHNNMHMSHAHVHVHVHVHVHMHIAVSLQESPTLRGVTGSFSLSLEVELARRVFSA